MGNRGWAVRDKEGRRLRIWLSPEDWRQIEATGKRRYFEDELNVKVERILAEWASSDRKRASSELVTGPVQLDRTSAKDSA